MFQRSEDFTPPFNIKKDHRMLTTGFILLELLQLSSSLSFNSPLSTGSILQNTSCEKPVSFQQIGNSFYCAISDVKEYDDQVRACKEIYGFPLCLRTEAVYTALKNYMGVGNLNGLGLGITDEGHEGNWTCANGRNLTSADFTMWAMGYPNGGTNKNCQWLSSVAFYAIQDIQCSQKTNFMCEFSATCDKLNTNEMFRVKDYSYCFNAVAKNYTASRYFCKSIGGDLACVRNDDVYNLIQDVMDKRGYSKMYISGTDIATEGQFICGDGSSMPSDHWAENEPNGGTKENCVAMWYGIRDFSCSVEFFSVCEIPSKSGEA